jgi:serine/threonine-protein kinase
LEHVRAIMLAPVGGSTAEFGALAAEPLPLDRHAVVHEEYPHPPVPPSDRRRWIWVLVVLALLAALGLVAFLLAPSSKRRVPDVSGDTFQMARSILSRDGFKVAERGTQSRIPAGRVIYTLPRARSNVSSGSTVTLVVSNGPPTVQIPNVVDAGQMAASRELRSRGLKVAVTMAPSDSIPQHHVISISPPAFTSVPVGTRVTLTVSSGKQTATMPSVIGESVSTARSTLSSAGFQVATVKQSSTQQPGTVLDQSPAANTVVTRGSVVTLTVAKPPRVTVPGVVGQPEGQAVNTITSAGLAPHTTDQPVTSPAQDGVVLSQTPSAGQKVKQGAGVTLVIGRSGTPTGPSGPTGAR